MMLFFFKSADDIVLGIVASVLAAIGFAGSLVFYNSFLPDIATTDQMDSVSAKGFSYGYVGSIILLIINLVIIQKPAWFGIDPDGTVSDDNPDENDPTPTPFPITGSIGDRVWYDVPPASWQCAIDSYRAWFGMSHVQGGIKPQVC